MDEKNQNEINEDNKNNYKDNNLYKLKNLIATTIINYILYPNYNIYLTIKNLYEAFFDYSHSPDISNKKYFFKKIIEINRSKKQIMKLIFELYDLVIKVDVRQLNFKENLIEKYIIGKFPNLIELNLAENCLYSIESLLNVEWKNLKYLILFTNRLGDENINYIENIDMKELILLNLENNYFTKYELLIAIGNNKKGSFKKLEELKIGLNDFKIAETKDNKKDRKTLEEIVNELEKLNFSSIKTLSANNGAFNQKTIEKILPALKLKDYENVDIRYNDLKNFNFIKGNNCNKNLLYEGNFFKENQEENIKQ